jgi:hypothetical protein
VAGNGDRGNSLAVRVTPNDGTVDGPAVTSMAVTVVNSPPKAVNDSGFSTEADLGLAIPVANLVANDNDIDADGDELDVLSVAATAVTQGTVVLNSALDQVQYTPDGTFTGTATFTYTVSDGFGGTSSTTVSVSVMSGSPVACRVRGEGELGRGRDFELVLKQDIEGRLKGQVTFTERRTNGRWNVGAEREKEDVDFAVRRARRASDLKFRSISITRLTCADGTARFSGIGLVNGVRVSFTGEAIERQGKRADYFAISWSGYSAAGDLTEGKIKVDLPRRRP